MSALKPIDQTSRVRNTSNYIKFPQKKIDFQIMIQYTNLNNWSSWTYVTCGTKLYYIFFNRKTEIEEKH